MVGFSAEPERVQRRSSRGSISTALFESRENSAGSVDPRQMALYRPRQEPSSGDVGEWLKPAVC